MVFLAPASALAIMATGRLHCRPTSTPRANVSPMMRALAVKSTIHCARPGLPLPRPLAAELMPRPSSRLVGLLACGSSAPSQLARLHALRHGAAEQAEPVAPHLPHRGLEAEAIPGQLPVVCDHAV